MPNARGDRKICSACRVDQGLEGFDRNRRMADGLNNQCRTCARASRDKSISKNPEGWRRYQKEWNRRARYGLEPSEYAAMLAAADGKCQVCGDPPKLPFKALDVDHDHATGRVRGLLCRPCNTAIGGARDDPRVLRSLAEYIEAHVATPLPDGPLQAPLRESHYTKGEAHHFARLTEAEVREIRALVLGGIRQREIGDRFGVTQAMVSLIAHRGTWKHLPDATLQEAIAARRSWDEAHKE